MILRNYYNILVGNMLGNPQGPNTNDMMFGKGQLTVGRSNDGSLLGWPKYHTYTLEAISLLNINSINTPGIIFGTGTVPVSFEDQHLTAPYEKLIAANYSWTPAEYNTETGKFETTFSCVVSNTGSEEVTLTEMGIIKKIYYGYNTTNQNNNHVLVYRELLETPITIGVGENVQYTHKFEIAIPEIK